MAEVTVQAASPKIRHYLFRDSRRRNSLAAGNQAAIAPKITSASEEIPCSARSSREGRRAPRPCLENSDLSGRRARQ